MRRLLFALTLALTIGAGWGASLAAAQEDEAAGHPLVGSWLVEVDVEGNPPLRLPNLASFTADGIVVVAAPALLPELPGADATQDVFSSGHGAWEPSGADAADVRFVFLVVDEQGKPSSINVIDGQLQVGADEETYSGEYTLTIVNADGQDQPPATGTWQATRISVGSDGMAAMSEMKAGATPEADADEDEVEAVEDATPTT